MLWPKIDDLIQSDRANEPLTKQLLDEYDSDLLDILQEIGGMLETVPRIFVQGCGNYLEPALELAERMEVEVPALFDLAANDRMVRDRLAHYFSSEMRSQLILRLGILHAQIFADFLRQRVTTPLALMRLQVESLALIAVASSEPRIAADWSAVGFGRDEGQALYRKYHQSKIVPALKRLNVYSAYELSSMMAVHARIAGLALGTRTTLKTEPTGSYRFERKSSVQEFDLEEPAPFIATVIHATVIQEQILSGLAAEVDEIDDPIFVNIKIPSLRARVQALAKRHRDRHERPSDVGSS